MNKIYLNQSNLKIILDTQVTITGAQELKIKYRRPDNIEGEWTGVEEDSTSVSYTFSDGELNKVGLWVIWAYVVFSDGRNAPGEPVNLRVYAEGT